MAFSFVPALTQEANAAEAVIDLESVVDKSKITGCPTNLTYSGWKYVLSGANNADKTLPVSTPAVVSGNSCTVQSAAEFAWAVLELNRRNCKMSVTLSKDIDLNGAYFDVDLYSSSRSLELVDTGTMRYIRNAEFKNDLFISLVKNTTFEACTFKRVKGCNADCTVRLTNCILSSTNDTITFYNGYRVKLYLSDCKVTCTSNATGNRAIAMLTSTDTGASLLNMNNCLIYGGESISYTYVGSVTAKNCYLGSATNCITQNNAWSMWTLTNCVCLKAGGCNSGTVDTSNFENVLTPGKTYSRCDISWNESTGELIKYAGHMNETDTISKRIIRTDGGTFKWTGNGWGLEQSTKGSMIDYTQKRNNGSVVSYEWDTSNGGTTTSIIDWNKITKQTSISNGAKQNYFKLTGGGQNGTYDVIATTYNSAGTQVGSVSLRPNSTTNYTYAINDNMTASLTTTNLVPVSGWTNNYNVTFDLLNLNATYATTATTDFATYAYQGKSGLTVTAPLYKSGTLKANINRFMKTGASGDSKWVWLDTSKFTSLQADNASTIDNSKTLFTGTANAATAIRFGDTMYELNSGEPFSLQKKLGILYTKKKEVYCENGSTISFQNATASVNGWYVTPSTTVTSQVPGNASVAWYFKIDPVSTTDTTTLSNNEATVTIPVQNNANISNVSKWTLFYYDTSTKLWTRHDSAPKAASGKLQFTTKHFSEWAVVDTSVKPVFYARFKDMNGTVIADTTSNWSKVKCEIWANSPVYGGYVNVKFDNAHLDVIEVPAGFVSNNLGTDRYTDIEKALNGWYYYSGNLTGKSVPAIGTSLGTFTLGLHSNTETTATASAPVQALVQFYDREKAGEKLQIINVPNSTSSVSASGSNAVLKLTSLNAIDQDPLIEVVPYGDNTSLLLVYTGQKGQWTLTDSTALAGSTSAKLHTLTNSGYNYRNDSAGTNSGWDWKAFRAKYGKSFKVYGMVLSTTDAINAVKKSYNSVSTITAAANTNVGTKTYAELHFTKKLSGNTSATEFTAITYNTNGDVNADNKLNSKDQQIVLMLQHGGTGTTTRKNWFSDMIKSNDASLVRSDFNRSSNNMKKITDNESNVYSSLYKGIPKS